jgi:hypothetical protein
MQDLKNSKVNETLKIIDIIGAAAFMVFVVSFIFILMFI